MINKQMKFEELPKNERLLVLQVLRGFMRDSQIHGDIGFEKTEEAMISLLNLGIMRLIRLPLGIGLSLYDFRTKKYQPLSTKNEEEE